MTPPRCVRCDRLYEHNWQRRYCAASCRDADRVEHPDRLARVLSDRASRHLARAAELDTEGRPDGAAALRRQASAWMAEANGSTQAPPPAP